MQRRNASAGIVTVFFSCRKEKEQKKNKKNKKRDTKPCYADNMVAKSRQAR